MFFRCIGDVASHTDISETTTTRIGSPSEIWAMLSSLYPSAVWDDRGWGYLDPATNMGDVSLFDDNGVAFRIGRIPVEEVCKICTRLGLVAFDGQKLLLIRPDA